VRIEPEVVTINAEAKVSVITLSGDHSPDYKGATFMGRPSTQITIKADKATFTIRRPVGLHFCIPRASETRASNAQLVGPSSGAGSRGPSFRVSRKLGPLNS
jgi:hypothetical protein